MLKKLKNNKGYMLVEIILASAIAFAIAYLIINLTIRIKNKNDDLMTTTLTSADQTIVSNKLSALLKEKGKDFDCGKLEINGKTITYDGNPVDTLNDYASYNISAKKEDWCYVDEEGTYIKINLPIEIKQQQDEYYDVNLYQEISVAKKEYMTCDDMIRGYSCKNKKGGSEPYTFTYTGNCTFIDDGNGNCRVKFTSDGNLTLNYAMKLDVFLVGGGGGGYTTSYSVGGAGGGGYTKTVKNITLEPNTYKIDIGAGGGAGRNGASSTIKLNNSIINDLSVDGGKSGAAPVSGCCGNCSWGGAGGNNGGGWSDCNQGTPFAPGSFGTGQGRTTCEFDQGTTSKCDSGVTDYAGGGCCGCCYTPRGGGGACSGGSGAANTGGGGGAYYQNVGSGGSGIIIIRNAREQ